MAPLVRAAAAAAAAMLAAACGGAASADARALPAPVLMWSPRAQVFGDKNQYVGLSTAGVPHTHVVDIVDRAVGAKAHGLELAERVVGANPGVAATAIFTAHDDKSHLHFAALAPQLKDLQRNLEEAKSSIVVPFTHAAEAHPWSSFLASKNTVLKAQCHECVTDGFRERVVAGLAEAKAKAEPLVLYIELSAPEVWESTMETVLGHLKELTGDNYLAVFHAAEGSTIAPERAEILLARKLQDGTDAPVRESNFLLETRVVTSTPMIIFGMLLSLFLLFALLIFLFCMDSLQAPTKFVKAYPPMGKVFE